MASRDSVLPRTALAMAGALLVLGLPRLALSVQPGTHNARAPAPFTTEAERCIVPAAQYHGVNHDILRAILRVESGLKPSTVARNDNGSIDVGIGQINSIHFKDLATYGISPRHLLDACVGTYVAAWNIKKHIAANGNSMQAIARYNSATPYFNRRYQILLHNELVKSGVVAGALMEVPPLRPGSAPSVRASRVSRPEAGRSVATAQSSATASVVYDR